MIFVSYVFRHYRRIFNPLGKRFYKVGGLEYKRSIMSALRCWYNWEIKSLYTKSTLFISEDVERMFKTLEEKRKGFEDRENYLRKENKDLSEKYLELYGQNIRLREELKNK